MNKRTAQSGPARRSPWLAVVFRRRRLGEGGFFNLRVLLGLLVALTGVVLALLGFGTFAVRAANTTHAVQNYTAQSSDPLVPPGFDCSKIHELGVDKQENLRARAIMIGCGLAEGGSATPGPKFSQWNRNLLRAPLAYGGKDVDLITGTETYPDVNQSTTFSWGNPGNPDQIVVAYNDTRGRNFIPIDLSGASVSTDGGLTFTRLTAANGQSPFLNTLGDPVVLYSRHSSTWYTVWLDVECGGQGLGGYKSTTPWDPNSWTHYCIFNEPSADRESGWVDNNPSSAFYGNLYVSWNDFDGRSTVAYANGHGHCHCDRYSNRDGYSNADAYAETYRNTEASPNTAATLMAFLDEKEIHWSIWFLESERFDWAAYKFDRCYSGAARLWYVRRTRREHYACGAELHCSVERSSRSSRL